MNVLVLNTQNITSGTELIVIDVIKKSLGTKKLSKALKRNGIALLIGSEEKCSALKERLLEDIPAQKKEILVIAPLLAGCMMNEGSLLTLINDNWVPDEFPIPMSLYPEKQHRKRKSK